MPSPVRFAKVRRYLESHGWTLVRISGSHHTFTRSGERRPLVIPVHHGKVDAIYEKQAHKRCE
jgi:predicted RNA binding protein YcfA (HicA-like mRNA interferase family)